MKHTVEEITLKNGAKGLLVDAPDAPVMNFNFCFRAGNYLAPDGKWEVPHVLEHLMFNGNEYYPTAQEFQIALEKNGAYANAITSNWYVSYESECADFESMRVLELVLQSLSAPLFLENEFKAEMGNVREELSGYLNNYFRLLNIAMMEKAGLVALSDSERINQMHNIVRQDMFDHHARTHTQQNLRFVIGGRMQGNKSKIISLIEQYSDKLPKGERFDLPSESPASHKEALTIERQDVQKLHYYLDLYLPQDRLSREQIDTANILERILTKSMTSKIFGEARRRGLAYGVSSGISTGRDNSRWWIGGNVRNDSAQQLFEVIIREMKHVYDGKLTQDDVEAAKLQDLGDFMRSSQRVADITRGYESRYYFEEKISDFDKIPDYIKSVTKERVVELARRFIDENEWDLGLLGQVDATSTKELLTTCKTLFNS